MNPPSPKVHIVHLDPVRAEVHFLFEPPALPAGAEIRGRLVGPRCPGVSTIEVAYPLRPMAERAGAVQVVIPEPSRWEPECPFTYEAIFEFWIGETCSGKLSVPVGLRLGVS